MGDLAVAQDNRPAMAWTDEDKRLIQETVAKGTSPSEFKLFLYTAHKYGLDPLVKQVWCVKYGGNPASIFTGRDGFLSIAHRSGKFNGMQSGVRQEGNELIGWCKVYRKDMEHPFEVEVALKEYTTGKSLWQSKPRTMIQKVAESQALRRAFDISGLYAPEEIDTEEPQQQMKNITPPREEANLLIDYFEKAEMKLSTAEAEAWLRVIHWKLTQEIQSDISLIPEASIKRALDGIKKLSPDKLKASMQAYLDEYNSVAVTKEEEPVEEEPIDEHEGEEIPPESEDDGDMPWDEKA